MLNMRRRLMRFWLGLWPKLWPKFWAVFLLVLFTVLLWGLNTPVSQAHWADLASAEIRTEGIQAQMSLTYPTQLTAFADSDGNGQLSAAEISGQAVALADFLGDRIRLQDSRQPSPQISVLLTEASLRDSGLSPKSPLINATSASEQKGITPNTHTTLTLNYRWSQPVQLSRIEYRLFPRDAGNFNCIATIAQGETLRTFLFTPQQKILSLGPQSSQWGWSKLGLAMLGALTWGAGHSLSPGHGKTLVGAYLVGQRATPSHAALLALTTTVTHTIGVLGLGLVALFASRYVVPEQLYSWFSLLSGAMVVWVGIQLLSRRQKQRAGHAHNHTQGHEHDHHAHTHHSHEHHDSKHHDPKQHHGHIHTHGHGHGHTHTHTHGEIGHDPAHTHLTLDHWVTWQSLILLGISGGLVPCPAALVLLLGAIALGNPGMGLLLVLSFSFGLAAVLFGLGVLVVYAKHWRWLPESFNQHRISSLQPLLKLLPTASALGITILGLCIFTRAALQIF